MEVGESTPCLNKGQKDAHSYPKPLNHYEKNATLRNNLPQILASVISCLMGILVGSNMTFGAILIPQLNLPDSELKITPEEGTWIVSSVALMMGIGTVFVGFVMEWLGRLNTIKVGIIPGCLGWILIATAKNLEMIMAGRMLGGIACALVFNPSPVYVAEIASPQIRGSLIAIAQVFGGLGMMTSYLLGWLLPWRTAAWVQIAFPIVTAILLEMIPESPPWLISKGKNERAKQGLEWLYKYYPQTGCQKSVADLHYDDLVERDQRKRLEHKSNTGEIRKFVYGFLKPTGYKPFIFQFVSFIFQQYTGIFVVQYYAVTFIEATGTKLNPFVSSVFIGVIRVVMSTVSVFLLRRFTRRGLLITSALTMGACMVGSGAFTYLIQEDKTDLTWVPVVFIYLFIMNSCYGLLPVPWAISAELYPLEIRSIMHSITRCIAQLMIFCATKSYIILDNIFGGSVGIQLFFAVDCAFCALYTFAFMPETHGKTLADIEEFYLSNTFYLGEKAVERNRRKYLENKLLVEKESTESGKVAKKTDESITVP